MEKKPASKIDFVEYSFDGSPLLNVPGDFNTQRPELVLMEGSVWYKKKFVQKKQPNKRYFIHFGSVSYKATVYLNGKLLGSHEGGFTPFQFEITNSLNDGENSLIVKVNNERTKDGLPGDGFDWFNYGGITRDVNLIETQSSFIEDYSIQLQKGSTTQVNGWLQLNGAKISEKVMVKIPELGLKFNSNTKIGRASCRERVF